jgi:hypothetical protein
LLLLLLLQPLATFSPFHIDPLLLLLLSSEPLELFPAPVYYATNQTFIGLSSSLVAHGTMGRLRCPSSTGVTTVSARASVF